MTGMLIDKVDIPLVINSLDNYSCVKLQLVLLSLLQFNVRINTSHF